MKVRKNKVSEYMDCGSIEVVGGDYLIEKNSVKKSSDGAYGISTFGQIVESREAGVHFR